MQVQIVNKCNIFKVKKRYPVDRTTGHQVFNLKDDFLAPL